MSALPVLADLDPALRLQLWRAHSWEQSHRAATSGVSSQFSALDRALPGGGWPARQLIELLTPQGIGELHLLLPVLASATRLGHTVLLVGPPFTPNAPAWAAQGVALEHLLLVPVSERTQRLWVTEQALKSGSVAAVVTWLPEKEAKLRSSLSLDVLRRLQLAASAMQQAPGLVFLIRSPEARALSSPAPLRIALTATAQGLTLEIFKRRGAPPAMPLPLALTRYRASSAASSKSLSHERTRHALAPSGITDQLQVRSLANGQAFRQEQASIASKRFIDLPCE